MAQQITDVSNFTKQYSTSVPFGNKGSKVNENLGITDESTIESRMSGGWQASGSAYYTQENKIGAYGGYIFDHPRSIDYVKFYISRYSGQNITLYVTAQYYNGSDWIDVEDMEVTTTVSYPVNQFTVSFASVGSVYGVRWYHYKTPQKSPSNNICFFGMTLYENQDAFTVHFDSKGGTGTMADQSIESGVATALSTNAFTKDGYIFKGWDTSSAGTTVVYDDEEVVTDLTSAGSTITLYAVWELAWGYLLKDDSNRYYTMDVSQNLTQLSGVSALSKAVFLQYGFQTTPVTSTLTSLSNPTVYKWDGSQAPRLEATMSAIPVPQVIKTQVDLSSSQIIGINNLEAEYTGNINVQYSYNDSTYTTATTLAAFLSMNKDTLYNGLTSSKQLYIKFIIMDENATLTRFKLTYKRRAFS
jgi:uncharacterized repeat protein (TIGR02543 family)